jgi:SHS2 domain-containing protein
MNPFHKFLDHTADVFFVARGNTLAELFEQCALAVEETMVELDKVKPSQKEKILAEADKIDRLLFDFLDELVFFKDYKQLVFRKFDLTIKEEEGKYSLTCLAAGEKIDPLRHNPKVDVKAITMHEFEVVKDNKGWKARVLVDI